MNSILQSEKRCYITGDTSRLNRHHIFGGNPGRKISEKNGFWCWLRNDYHNGANYGVHGKDGHNLNLALKRECQKKYEETHSRDEFMAFVGKNYLEEE